MPGKYDQTAQAVAAHWASLLNDAQACHLRAFEGNGEGSRDAVFLKVEVEHFQKFREMASENKELFAAVLRAVWALVLRCYTGMEEVCFGYQEAGLETDSNALVEACNGFDEPIVQVGLDETVTLGDLVQKMKSKYLQGGEYRIPLSGDGFSVGETMKYPYNTAVELRGSTARAHAKAILNEVSLLSRLKRAVF